MAEILTLRNPRGSGSLRLVPARQHVLAVSWLVMLVAAVPTIAAPLRVGIEPNTQPLSLIDANGRAAGFAADLMRAIAADAGLEVEFAAASWEKVYADFRAGKIDVLAACGRNPERESQMMFTTPHIDLKTGVFVNSSQRAPRALAEIANRKLGTTRASLSEAFARRQGWQQLVYFDALPQALAALDRGEIDVVLASQAITSYYIREARFRNITLTMLEVPGLSYELHMAVPRSDVALLYTLNRSLARLRADRTYDRIYEKWIGPLELRAVRLRDVQPYLVGLVALGGVIALVLIWQRRLLQQLARQAAQLRESEQRLSLVIEGSEDAFWDWDIKAGRISRSERWASMLGYTLDEIEPTYEGGRRLIHPDDLAAFSEWKKRFDEGVDRYEIEYRMKTKSGEWLWIHDRGKIVSRDTNGLPLRMAGTHTDITQRKKTEAALIESEENLRRSAKLLQQTQSSAHIGGWEVDLRTDKLYWTEETFRLHDTTAATYRPTVETAIAFYAPESRSIITSAVENAVRHGTPYDLELELVTAKGRTIRVQTTGRAEFDSGRVVKIYGSFRDITAEKLAEEDRRKLHLKMLEAQKLESLGVLAGGIAHDFNNLLTVILANATFARDTATGSDARLVHIETAARRAADLCRQLLAYAGKGSFIVERTDLGDLVRDTAQLLQVSISKKARLSLTLAADLPHVDADASQLRQVIVNLVINASEAIGDTAGEIRLTTRIARPENPSGGILHSFDLPPGDCVCLEIADTGHGMTPPTLARIFDPFFTTKFAGRGLGLAAVLGIMRAHRGALTVESTAGSGTTFRLFLPAAAPSPAAPKPAPEQPPQKAATGTILLVDDEPVVLATADALLRHQGYRTVLAADGHEAVHQFRAAPRGFAAVVLDLTMPGLDGSEVLRVIRALNPDVPVLIMSGFSEHEILARVRGQGDVPMLRKPFTHEKLLAKVAEVVARK